MKLFLYLFSLWLVLGFSNHLKAQEIENPKEELVDKEWYLTKLVIDEEEMPFISNEEVEQALLEISFLNENDNTASGGINYCDYGAVVMSFEEDEVFYINTMSFLTSYPSYCTLPENSSYEITYNYKFWNNPDLLIANDAWYPYRFTYSIEQHENHQNLIVINDAGYEAHYQSVPYMSVDKNEFSNLNIYPNPVQESFQIENLTEKSNLKIYDISGKEIFEQAIHSSTENVDVSQLSSGLYFYGIFQEGRRVKTGKLVKE